MTFRHRYQSIPDSPLYTDSLRSFCGNAVPEKLPGPRRLQPWYKSYRGVIKVLMDLGAAIFALLFLIFAFMVRAADGQILDQENDHLISLAQWGPTLFPVLFAAVVGRSMRAFATWSLQRGTTIGRVEQLMGSITMARTFSTQLSLNAFNLLGFSLLGAWCLSPLGSQASLRIIYTEPIFTAKTTNLLVMDPFSRYHSTKVAEFYGPPTTLKALFTTSMVSYSSLKSQNQDVWGNIRVPLLDEALTKADLRDWRELADGDITYSSLVGIPVDERRMSENTTYVFPASYLDITCPVFELRPSLTDKGTKPTIDEDCPWVSNAGNGFSISVSCRKPIVNSMISRDARVLLFESLSANEAGSSITHAECQLTTVYVDVSASCMEHTCHLNSARPSSNPPRHPSWTVFDIDGEMQSITTILREFAEMFPNHSEGRASPIVQFLADPDDAFTDDNEYVLYNVGRRNFEIRLTQLLNTQLLIGISPRSVANSRFNNSSGQNTFNTSIGTVTTGESPFYVRCDHRWFFALVISSLVSLIIALAGSLARSTTLVPDILGTLSIAMLENECRNIAEGGSTLDAATKTSILSKVRVRLGDIEPLGEVGRIALAGPLDQVSVDVVKKSRVYR